MYWLSLVSTTMAHYHNQYERVEILKKNPSIFERTPSRVLSFINLCIHPYQFETVYESLRTQERISYRTYEALKGSILGLLVLVNRKHKDAYQSVDNYVLDFISFIRNDSKADPIRFLLSMRAYMVRYLFIKGLNVAFGIDWKQLVVDALELKRTPMSTSYHSLCTNIYVRNLLRVYVVWKNYREVHEEDYCEGVNDVNSLLDKAAAHKTSLDREKLVSLLEHLRENLPSWNYSTRRRASYAIDTSADGWDITNRQMTDYRYKLTQG